MIKNEYKYNSSWYTEDIFKNYFTPAQVDALNAAVAVLSNDPINPKAEDAWILRQGNGGVPISDGTPMGLLLALTYTDDVATAFSYQFSYKDKNGVINRLLIA